MLAALLQRWNKVVIVYSLSYITLSLKDYLNIINCNIGMFTLKPKIKFA